MSVLHQEDHDLLAKLQAIPPDAREAAIDQINRDWKPNSVWQAVYEWLIISIRYEESPDLELAFSLGEATERLRWVVHRAPVTGATPETLALERQKARRALLEKGGRQQAGNAWRQADADDWRRVAREIAATRPKYETKGGRIEDVINKALKDRGFDTKAPSTIRKAIRHIARPE